MESNVIYQQLTVLLVYQFTMDHDEVGMPSSDV